MDKVFGNGWNNIKFRGNLRGDLELAWQQLHELCVDVVLSDEKDKMYLDF